MICGSGFHRSFPRSTSSMFFKYSLQVFKISSSFSNFHQDETVFQSLHHPGQQWSQVIWKTEPRSRTALSAANFRAVTLREKLSKNRLLHNDRLKAKDQADTRLQEGVRLVSAPPHMKRLLLLHFPLSQQRAWKGKDQAISWVFNTWPQEYKA